MWHLQVGIKKKIKQLTTVYKTWHNKAIDSTVQSLSYQHALHKLFFLGFMEIAHIIVMSVVFVLMSNFVIITNVVPIPPTMNVAFVWR